MDINIAFYVLKLLTKLSCPKVICFRRGPGWKRKVHSPSTFPDRVSHQATDVCAEHQAATMTSTQEQHRKQGPHPTPQLIREGACAFRAAYRIPQGHLLRWSQLTALRESKIIIPTLHDVGLSLEAAESDSTPEPVAAWIRSHTAFLPCSAVCVSLALRVPVTPSSLPRV